MAQSVVEVMEDAEGKVQENLLANGGESCQPSRWPSPWPQVVTAVLCTPSPTPEALRGQRPAPSF